MSDRIAMFTPRLRSGGAERVSVNLAAGLVDRGFTVDMVLTEKVGPLLADVPSEVSVIDLGARRVLTSLTGLASYLRSHLPAALITHQWHSTLAAIWARWLAGVDTKIVAKAPNTLSMLSREPTSLRSRFVPLLVRVFAKRVDQIVAVSQGVAQDLSITANVPLERIHVIYNPVITPALMKRCQAAVDHPWFENSTTPVVLGAGRLVREKDFSTLIKAFALLRQERPARLMIVGEGVERPMLEALVRELEVEADVQLPGYVENPHALMSRCDVFVLSSITEGLAGVLIEALVAGAPVVSTDCKWGPREILDDGRLGRLVPPGEDQALAAAIAKTLDQPSRRASAEDMERYSLDFAVNRYLQVLGMSENE
jgi:glycosyltransferase involved in cell wall biosynthesis